MFSCARPQDEGGHFGEIEMGENCLMFISIVLAHDMSNSPPIPYNTWPKHSTSVALSRKVFCGMNVLKETLVQQPCRPMIYSIPQGGVELATHLAGNKYVGTLATGSTLRP